MARWCTCWSTTRGTASASAPEGRAASLDLRLLLAARTRGHRASLDRIASAYSRSGEHALCWLALGACGAWLDRPNRGRWLRGMRIVAASYGLNYAVKLLVRRRRPRLEGLPPLTPTVSRYSFPSAHATTSFAAAGAYRGLAPGQALYGAAALFGVTRPYLGVHYPSDVVAGVALGTALAAAWPGGGDGRCP